MEGTSTRLDTSTENRTLTQDNSDGTTIENIKEVYLKKTPIQMTNKDSTGTLTGYTYSIENKRPYSVRFVMAFTGSNLAVKMADSSKPQPSAMEVNSIFEANQGYIPFVTISSADLMSQFNSSAQINVIPIHDDEVKESDLEGVKLITTITHTNTDDVSRKINWQAENSKSFAVRVHLSAEGKMDPLQVIVQPGTTVHLGSKETSDLLDIAWKWSDNLDMNAPIVADIKKAETTTTTIPSTAAKTDEPAKKNDQGVEKVVRTSELKDVTLRQLITPGEQTLVEFELVNNRDVRITAEIDLEGDGEFDFRGQPRPLIGQCFAKQSAFVGVIAIKGDCTVNWKYKEEK